MAIDATGIKVPIQVIIISAKQRSYEGCS